MSSHSITGKRSAQASSDGDAASASCCPLQMQGSPDQVTKRLKAAMLSSLFDSQGYYPLTSLPLEGWMSPCRYCQVFTSNCLPTTQPGEHVPVCRRCENKLVAYFKQAHQAQLSSLPQFAQNPQQQQQQQSGHPHPPQQQSPCEVANRGSSMPNAWTASGQTSPSFSVLSLGSESIEERMTPRE